MDTPQISWHPSHYRIIGGFRQAHINAPGDTTQTEISLLKNKSSLNA